MGRSLKALLGGYKGFRDQYASIKQPYLKALSSRQRPQVMLVGCCDARVDPGFMLGCEPGDLFMVRNVANIVPPYELDDKHHGTSAALEFGIRFLGIKDLIILGHSNCGGIHARLSQKNGAHNDFIDNWVSVLEPGKFGPEDVDECAKHSLKQSYENCLTFPWIEGRILTDDLKIHLWFFDIKAGQILAYDYKEDKFKPIEI